MELLIGENEMSNLLMNDTFVWGVVAVGVIILAWLWWPKKKVAEALEEVKAAEEPVKVEPQITDAVTAPVKKVAAKKAPAKKTAAPKKTTTTKTKAAPKKAVKKGKK
jgi:hypothetical protein